MINKQRGMVSKDVSRWLQKRLGKLHIGHVGTLDPLAEGILPILLGPATRLQDFLLELPKTYQFDMTLGYETTTLDSEGLVTEEASWDHVTGQVILDVLNQFRGPITQIPPIYSAVKFKGKALYEYARSDKGEQVPTDTLLRNVTIHNLAMLRFVGGVATLEVTASKGTYVRTLVKDIARAVGTLATMTRLVRTAAAGVSIDAAHTLDFLEPSLPELNQYMVPVEEFGIMIPRWKAPNPEAVIRLQAGQTVSVDVREFVPAADLKGGDFSGFEISVQWLLLDSNGKAFGLGGVRHGESGRVAVNMKRGLL